MQYYAGSVSLSGDHLLEDDTTSYRFLVIDGDMSVAGSLAVNIEDMCNILWIKGNLTADNLLLDAETILVVEGQITIQGTLYSGISDAGILVSKGTLTASNIFNVRNSEMLAPNELEYLDASDEMIDADFSDVIKMVVN